MLRLLAVLLAVPVISFAVARGVLYKFNSDWRAAVHGEIDKAEASANSKPEDDGSTPKSLGKVDPKKYPDGTYHIPKTGHTIVVKNGIATDYGTGGQRAQETVLNLKVLQMLPLQAVCSDPELSNAWTGCGDVQAVELMSAGAVGGALVGIALVGLIGLAGRLCRSSRRLLLALFGPGLHVTILILIGLIFLHAALAMGSIYYGEGEFLGRIHFGIVIAIALGALAGVVGMVRGIAGIVHTATTTVVGKKLDLDGNEPLAKFLQDLTRRVGTSTPNNVVVGLNPNFFVTEAHVKCLDGTLIGRSLYISLPLSRILTKSEMAAVLGHELGHFQGRDTEFSQKFYPIYRGTADSLAGLSANVGDGARATAIVPALWTLAYFYDCFAAAETRLGRERELEADAVGARATSPRIIATALLKVCAFAPLWEGVYDQMREAISQHRQFINVSAYWAAAINTLQDRNSVFDGIDARHLMHPTDSHPPLGARLEALHFSLPDLAADALQTAPAHAGIELITGHEALEKELTDVEHLLLADSMKGLPEHQAEPGGRPALPSSEKVRAISDKARTLTEGGRKATVGDLLNLMHEADNLAQDHSISVAERFRLWRLSDAIKDTLDTSTDIPESPEREQLRQDHARYKEAFSPEFEMLMERFCESGSAEDTKALGDLLFLKEHRARLVMILDHATDSETATYGELFADWVRLKGYSPAQVAEHVDADAIQRLRLG